MEEVNSLIKTLIVDKFYGSITLKFEAGNIVHCKKEESIKLQSLAEVYEKAVKDYSEMYLSQKKKESTRLYDGYLAGTVI